MLWRGAEKSRGSARALERKSKKPVDADKRKERRKRNEREEKRKRGKDKEGKKERKKRARERQMDNSLCPFAGGCNPGREAPRRSLFHGTVYRHESHESPGLECAMGADAVRWVCSSRSMCISPPSPELPGMQRSSSLRGPRDTLGILTQAREANCAGSFVIYWHEKHGCDCSQGLRRQYYYSGVRTWSMERACLQLRIAVQCEIPTAAPPAGLSVSLAIPRSMTMTPLRGAMPGIRSQLSLSPSGALVW